MKKYLNLLLICFIIYSCNPESDNIIDDIPVVEEDPTDDLINISSLAELREYAAENDGNIKMAAGTYTINDASYFKDIAADRYDDTSDQIVDGVYNVTTLLHFSGDNNTFDLTGVEITVDTSIYPDIDNNGKINEVYISGTNNTIKGLSFKNLGDGYTAPYTDGTSAVMLLLAGVDNTLEDVSLYIVGSWPYGYGNLLGKSTDALVSLHKHSSLLIVGTGGKLSGCSVITRAFGHGVVLQGAVDTLIEDCYVEGEMRSTNDMLSGDLSDITKFVTVDGKDVPASYYAPGYFEEGHMISMQEDGVRTYLDGPFSYSRTKGVTVRNTTVKNMRNAFILVFGSGDMLVYNCTAIDCEVGYSGGTGITISGSKGDAKYGPLFSFPYKSGKNCTMDLKLTESESDFPPLRLGEINGTGHSIVISKEDDSQSIYDLPIVFGECAYADDKFFRGYAYSEYVSADNVTLNNKTGEPVRLTDLSNGNKVSTNGTVIDNGTSNSITSN